MSCNVSSNKAAHAVRFSKALGLVAHEDCPDKVILGQGEEMRRFETKQEAESFAQDFALASRIMAFLENRNSGYEYAIRRAYNAGEYALAITIAAENTNDLLDEGWKPEGFVVLDDEELYQRYVDNEIEWRREEYGDDGYWPDEDDWPDKSIVYDLKEEQRAACYEPWMGARRSTPSPHRVLWYPEKNKRGELETRDALRKEAWLTIPHRGERPPNIPYRIADEDKALFYSEFASHQALFTMGKEIPWLIPPDSGWVDSYFTDDEGRREFVRTKREIELTNALAIATSFVPDRLNTTDNRTRIVYYEYTGLKGTELSKKLVASWAAGRGQNLDGRNVPVVIAEVGKQLSQDLVQTDKWDGFKRGNLHATIRATLKMWNPDVQRLHRVAYAPKTHRATTPSSRGWHRNGLSGRRPCKLRGVRPSIGAQR
jgi:hypothetical protein